MSPPTETASVDTVLQIGREADPRVRLDRLRGLIAAAKGQPATTPDRARVLLETQSLLLNSREQIAAENTPQSQLLSEDIRQLEHEVQAIIRTEHPLTKAHVGSQTLSYANSVSELRHAAPRPVRMINTFRRADMVTQSLVLGTLVAGASTIYGAVRNAFLPREQRSGLWSWTKRTTKAVAGSVGLLWLWHWLSRGRSGPGNGDNPAQRSGSEQRPAQESHKPPSGGSPPEQQSGSSIPPPENVERHPPLPSDLYNTPAEAGSSPVWELDYRVLTHSEFRADATIDEQRWYENTRTGKRYSRSEMLTRLAELKAEYKRRYPDLVDGQCILLSIDGKGAAPDVLVAEGGRSIARAAGVTQMLRSRDSHRPELPTSPNLPVSIGENDVTVGGVRYLTEDRYSEGLIRTYAPNRTAYDDSPDEFKAQNKHLSDLQITTPVELSVVLGRTMPVPLHDLAQRIQQPETSKCLATWPVRVLGPDTDPKAVEDSILLPEGDARPCTVAAFQRSLEGVAGDCSPMPVTFNIQLQRTAKSAPGATYQPLIDSLYRQGHQVYLNSLTGRV